MKNVVESSTVVCTDLLHFINTITWIITSARFVAVELLDT